MVEREVMGRLATLKTKQFAGFPHLCFPQKLFLYFSAPLVYCVFVVDQSPATSKTAFKELSIARHFNTKLSQNVQEHN